MTRPAPVPVQTQIMKPGNNNTSRNTVIKFLTEHLIISTCVGLALVIALGGIGAWFLTRPKKQAVDPVYVSDDPSCYSYEYVEKTDSVTITWLEDDSLTVLRIPGEADEKPVTSIGENAFSNCTNLIIFGESNSYAEQYAKENDLPFVGK